MKPEIKKTVYTVGFFGFKKKEVPDSKYASLNRRMLAATIDSVLAMIILAPFIDLFLSWYSPLPPLDMLRVKEQITPEMTESEVNQLVVHYLLSSGYVQQWFSNLMLQYTGLSIVTGLCWRLWSATPGKMLLRMKVVDSKTEAPLTDTQIIIRLFGYVVSTLTVCIGFFWIGFDKRRQGFHDKLAGSVVIVIPKKSKSTDSVVDASGSPAPSAKE